MNNQLLEHHIRDTERRFNEMADSTTIILNKLDDLKDFKVSMIASSRFVSMIVGAVCGLLSLIASTVVTYYVNLKLK